MCVVLGFFTLLTRETKVPGSWSTTCQAYYKQPVEAAKPPNLPLKEMKLPNDNICLSIWRILCNICSKPCLQRQREAVACFWATYHTIRLLSLKYIEWSCRDSFMLDQLYNAINILKPFGACQAYCCLHLFPLFPYLLILNLFGFCCGLCWAIKSLLSSQHKLTASLVAGCRHTGIKWRWASLGCKYCHEMETSSKVFIPC